MKKMIIVVLICALLVPCNIFSQTIGTSKVKIKDKVMQVNAIIKDGFTYINSRDLGRAVGIVVDYEPETHSATFKNESNYLAIQLGSGQALLNGQYINNATLIIYNDSSYFPFRWICENMGYKVNYTNGIISVEQLGRMDSEVKVGEMESKEERYFEFLIHIGTFKRYAIDAIKRDDWSTQDEYVISNIKKQIEYIDTVLIPELKGTEYEDEIQRWVDIPKVAQKVFENNGDGFEEFTDMLVGIDGTTGATAAKLEDSERTYLSVIQRLNDLLD